MSSKIAVQPAARPQAYRVQLAVFEGPLDLLLHLIEREKLDISSVSLAQVADQFLQYLAELETIGADTLAEFLVVAARLVCIKSRLLLPPSAISTDDEDDQGETLARQLREYKRYKEVASALQSIEEAGRRSYLRIAEAPELERRLAVSELSLADLLAAAVAVLATPLQGPLVASVVAPFTVTISEQIELIWQMTAYGREVAFSGLIAARNRQEVIVTLLAVLELLKRSRINVQQDTVFGEIKITQVLGAETTPVDLDNGNGDRDQ